MVKKQFFKSGIELAGKNKNTWMLGFLASTQPTDNAITLSPDIDEEFYRYEEELVKGQLKGVEEEIGKLQREHPQLRSLDMEQLREQLLDIEADTYAEFIRPGRLNTNLSPLLQEILAEAQEK